MELEFLHPDISVEIFIECPEGIVDIGIIAKEFMKENCILLGRYTYGNVDTDLLRLRLVAKYLIK